MILNTRNIIICNFELEKTLRATQTLMGCSVRFHKIRMLKKM